MPHTLTAWIGLASFAFASAGCIYALGAAAIVRRLAGEGRADPAAFPGVTLLKPLHGAESGLYDDLATFCDQDYRGPVQILFGLQDGTDAAAGVVARLIAERPGRDLELVAHEGARAANPKIANVAPLEERMRHDIAILSDADIAVPRDYLARVVAALERPGVGAVTCLYRGVARGGLWARLASMGIDYHFLPDVLVGLRLGLARPCFGSTIALRRETLAAIGGWRAFADYIADDYAIGQAVRATGLTVTVLPLVLAHSCTEASAAELLRHEVRWARTVRAVNAMGFAGSAITHPLPFALLTAALAGFGAAGISMIALAIACRLVLQWQVDHTLRLDSSRWWLGPARDLLAFGVFGASFMIDVVRWRDRRYRVRADGTLIPVGERKP